MEYYTKQNIHKARKFFSARVGMTRFAGNYSRDRKFQKTNWMCRCLLSREVEVHLTSSSCPVYADIREKYGDLTTDDELVAYFGEVLARRQANKLADDLLAANSSLVGLSAEVERIMMMWKASPGRGCTRLKESRDIDMSVDISSDTIGATCDAVRKS